MTSKATWLQRSKGYYLWIPAQHQSHLAKSLLAVSIETDINVAAG